MSDYDRFLARQLAQHDADLDRAERAALDRIERLPETLPADIDDADLGVLFEVIGGDSMLGEKFRELLSVALNYARTDEALVTAARSFGSELIDVCADLCVVLDRDSLPWDIGKVIDAMPDIESRRMSERLRAASFPRGAA